MIKYNTKVVPNNEAPKFEPIASLIPSTSMPPV